MPDFKDKVVLVTGGATGIGLAAALAFGRRGAKVVIAGRRQDAGDKAVAALAAADCRGRFVATDVTRPEEIERLAWEGVKKFDGKTAIYIKPMYWAEHGSPISVVAPDANSTRFALCLFEAPMHTAKPSSLTVSPFRRPSPETAMTEAKTGRMTSTSPSSGREPKIASAARQASDSRMPLITCGQFAR